MTSARRPSNGSNIDVNNDILTNDNYNNNEIAKLTFLATMSHGTGDVTKITVGDTVNNEGVGDTPPTNLPEETAFPTSAQCDDGGEEGTVGAQMRGVVSDSISANQCGAPDGPERPEPERLRPTSKSTHESNRMETDEAGAAKSTYMDQCGAPDGPERPEPGRLRPTDENTHDSTRMKSCEAEGANSVYVDQCGVPDRLVPEPGRLRPTEESTHESSRMRDEAGAASTRSDTATGDQCRGAPGEGYTRGSTGLQTPSSKAGEAAGGGSHGGSAMTASERATTARRQS